MKKPIIFAAALAAVALVAGYFFLLPLINGTPAAAIDEEEEDEPVAEQRVKKLRRPAEPELVYQLPERVLNLSATQGTPRYARFQLALEFERPKNSKPAAKPKEGEGEGKEGPAPVDPALEPVVARMVMIDDALVRIFGSMTADELTTAEGKEALKTRVLEAVTELVASPEPVGVYILRLVVQ